MLSMKKQEKISYLLIVIFMLGFITSHVTPEWSVRTKLFFSGYLKTALSSEVVKIDEKTLFNAIENESVTYFQINPAPVEKATNTSLNMYQVEKKLGLFFSAFYSDI